MILLWGTIGCLRFGVAQEGEEGGCDAVFEAEGGV